MNSVNTRKLLLGKLLKPLLDEWGADEVRTALEKLVIQSGEEGERTHRGRKSQSGPSGRLNAIGLVDRLNIEGERKRPLADIATRFDEKDFLPSIADVREFIIMAGERPPAMKSRHDSFRNLLRVLLRLPPERLRQIAEAASHAGPAQLGPISDAIAAAGQRLPRRNHDPDR